MTVLRVLYGGSVPRAVPRLCISAAALLLVALAVVDATDATPFAGTIFEEPLATDTVGAPYYRRAFSGAEQSRLQGVVTSTKAAAAEMPHKRQDSLLTEQRTGAIYYQSSQQRFTTYNTNEDNTRVHAITGSMVTQYFYAPLNASSPVADITHAWPYYYHYADFITREAATVHRRVYQGIVDVDREAVDLLTDNERFPAGHHTPAEVLLLVYNDWDSSAMEHLATLERFAYAHTHGRGARLYESIDKNDLNPKLSNVLNRPWRPLTDFAQVSPDGFFRLMQQAYLADNASGEAAAEVYAQASVPTSNLKSKVLLLMSDETLAPEAFEAAQATKAAADDASGAPPRVSGVVQLAGALRLASFPGDRPNEVSSLFFTTPSPQFLLLGPGGLYSSPRLTPSSPRQVTPLTLQRFVLRHSVSSLFIRSYTQAARLVSDYGRVAFLTLSDACVADMRTVLGQQTESAVQKLLQRLAASASVRALREVVPFFIMVPPEGPGVSPAPDWWSSMPVLAHDTIDAAAIVAPLPKWGGPRSDLTAAVDRFQRSATLTVVETATPRRNTIPSPEAPWTRQELSLPLISPDSPPQLQTAYDWLVGSAVVDAVSAWEAQRPVVAVDGSNFQETLQNLRGEANMRPDSVADVVVVLDAHEEAAGDALSCAERLRVYTGVHPTETAKANTRFMVVDAVDRDFTNELLRAAWPLPSSGVNLTGATVCPALRHPGSMAGLDLAGCTVLCIPGSDKNLYRLGPLHPDVEAAAAAVGGAEGAGGFRPLEHPNVAELHKAMADLAEEVGPVESTDAGEDEDALPEAYTEWQETEHTELPWRLALPAGFTTPLVEFDFSDHPIAGTEDGKAHVILLTDSACAQCATITKVFRLLRSCIDPAAATLHEVDIVRLLGAPASEQASLLYSHASSHAMPYSLLGPHFLLGSSAAATVRPPRLVVQRGHRVLLTLNTVAYYQRAPWARSVLDVAAAAFTLEGDGFPGYDAVLQCVEDLTREELMRKSKFRGHLAAPA